MKRLPVVLTAFLFAPVIAKAQAGIPYDTAAVTRYQAKQDSVQADRENQRVATVRYLVKQTCTIPASKSAALYKLVDSLAFEPGQYGAGLKYDEDEIASIACHYLHGYKISDIEIGMDGKRVFDILKANKVHPTIGHITTRASGRSYIIYATVHGQAYEYGIVDDELFSVTQ